MTQPELWYDRWEEALVAVLRSVYGKVWSQKAAADLYGRADDVIAKGKWPRVGKKAASETPRAFRDMLLDMARSCRMEAA